MRQFRNLQRARNLSGLPMMAAVWLAVHHLKHNWRALLDISKVWIVILATATVAVAISPNAGQVAYGNTPSDGLGSDILIVAARLVISAVSMAAIAIAWHRLILKGQRSNDPVQLAGDVPLWKYMWRWFAYALMAAVLAVIVGTALHLAALMIKGSGLQSLNQQVWSSIDDYNLINLVMVGLGSYWLLRLGVRLPALAVGDWQWSTGAIWSEGKVLRKPVFGATIATCSFMLLLQGIHALAVSASSTLLGDATVPARIAVSLIDLVVWLPFAAFGIAILTVLYGLLNGTIKLEEVWRKSS